MGSTCSDEISSGIKYIDAHPDKTPDVGLYIGWFLRCSQAGGAFDKPYDVDNIKKLCKKAIRKIKEQGIITDDNDYLFKYLRECAQCAIDGENISPRTIDFASLVAGYYLSFKKGDGIIVAYNSQTLTNIYRERRNPLNNRCAINESVTRLLDYTEAHTRVVGKIELSYRFNEKEVVTYGPYYSVGTDDERYIKLMRDVKYYIYPQEFRSALNSCKQKIPLDITPYYVQSIILLEFKQPFEDIYEFLKRNVARYLDAIVYELVRYSKKGTDFYRYVKGKQNHTLSRNEEKMLNRINNNHNMLSNELRKRRKITPHISPNEKYDRISFQSRLEEQRYLEEQTKSFDLARFAKSNQQDAIIFIGYDSYYALSSMSNPKKALVNLYQFNSEMGKSREVEEVRRFYEFLKGDCEVGYPFIEITKKDNVLDIKPHMPKSLSEYQIEQLNAVIKLLEDASSPIGKNATNRISQNEIERCISKIRYRIERSRKDDEKKIEDLYRKNKIFNPGLSSDQS